MGFIGVVLLVVLAVAVIGGGTYAYVKNKTTKPQDNIPFTTTKSVDTTYKGESGGIKVESRIKADVTQTVDCGSQDCFNKKFLSCEPATLKADVEGLGAVLYKIVGKGATGCNMTFKYTNYPDLSWVNKEMTCEFDNKISFDDAISKIFNGVSNGTIICKGPLYDILRPR